jgi:chemotaxis protein MotB
VDQKKFAALKDGLATGLGSTTDVVVSGGTSINSTDGVAPAAIDLSSPVRASQSAAGQQGSASGSAQSRAPSSAQTSQDTLAAARREAADLAALEKRILAALRPKGLVDSVRFKVTERGLVVALVSDDVFFANASADLRPKGRVVLRVIAPVLRSVPQQVAVEGHANHLALRSSAYPSNWELSAARAGSVVRYLQADDGVAATRLSATGYGSSRPLYPRSDERSIRFNRRVDVVLVSDQPSAVRSLVPKIAPQLSTL